MKQNSSWGTSDWFSKKLKEDGVTSPDGYFSYKKNAFQIMRIRAVLEFVKTHVSSKLRNPQILDIGSATGVLTSALKKMLESENVKGIDFSQDLVNYANNLYGDIEFEKGALPNLDFEDNSYDFLSLIEVLYYLPESERKKALIECHRVLKKDGLMLFCSNISRPPYLSSEEILSLFSSARLEVITSSKLNFSSAIVLEGFLIRLRRFLKRLIFSTQDFFIIRISLGNVFKFFESITISIMGWGWLFNSINTFSKLIFRKRYTHAIFLLRALEHE